MKLLRIDSTGNLMVGAIAILIAGIILLVIFVATAISLMEENTIDSISNDNFRYVMEDYNKNIEKSLHESVEEVSEKVTTTRHASWDSSKEIEKKLEKKLEATNKEYEKRYGVKINSNVLSVTNTSNPSFIQCQVKIDSKKDSDKFTSIITSKASIEGLKDPLPFIKCGKSLTFFQLGDRIYYGTSLATYLELHGMVETSKGYIGASSPLTIKKCPFDPYKHHGDGNTLKKCLDEGYFHESADGSCYLCRLEGKGTCPHYGFEVFITTPLNPEIEASVSAPDHVIYTDRYPGLPLDYSLGQRIFLDSSHRLKYGLI